ncbi:MAG: hypothetical protein ACOCX7_01170, partial [Bacteroidota bacterium]
MKRLLKLSMLALSMMIALSVNSHAQALLDMTFNAYQGTFNQITGGTQIVTTADDNTYIIGLPFEFKYDNVMYDQVYMNANGLLTFYPATGYYFMYYSNGIHANRPTIHCMMRDLYTRGEMRVEVQGAAPNRVAIFQWLEVDFYYSYNANMNFQVKLYETSNIVEIVYGDMDRGSFNFGTSYYYWCGVGFSGTGDAYSEDNYINVEPGPTFTAHFSDVNPEPYYYEKYVRSVDDFGYFQNGLTLQLTAFPSFVRTFPQDETILQRGEIYTDDEHPACFFDRIASQAEVAVRYKIAGPLPSDNPQYQVIYEATAEGNPNDLLHMFDPQPVGTPGRGNISSARGIAARSSDGAFDLLTNEDQIPGGEYVVMAEMVLPSQDDYTQTLPNQIFVIALDNDLAITNVFNPKMKDQTRYPFGTGVVPVSIRASNIGMGPVRRFDALAYIYDMDGNLVYDDSLRWNAFGNNALTTGQSTEIVFTNFRPQEVGDYEAKFEVRLLDSVDAERSNNFYPRASIPDLIFNVAYEIEAAADRILAPQDILYVGRPIRPRALFRNVGVSDISDAPSHVEIIDANGDVVYQDDVIIQDIPSGRHNTASIRYSRDFIPETAGMYTITASVNSPDDPVSDNNTVTDNFEVIEAMSGHFTIGYQNEGDARNYTTIIAAVNDLYQKGLSGPVVFELTDENYEVGSELVGLNSPALDLSARIIGASAENTITFVPSQLRSIRPSSINIKLNSSNGIGINFGQEFAPKNPNAAVHGVSRGILPEYARSLGYIAFDGGENKSFSFKLNTSSDFRAPFYLGEGSRNIAIRNCHIGNFDSQNVSMASSLPLMMYDVALTKFVYQEDNRIDDTYSAGIVMRNTPPTDKETGNNS